MTPNSDPSLHAASDAIDSARRWLDEHGRIAVATVIDTWGSSPVPVGGQMVVSPDERFAGSVSGGCVEAEVIVAAAEVIADGRPRSLAFGVANDTAWDVGLPCGGNIRVLIERLTAAHDAADLELIAAAARQRRPLVVATRLSDGGRRLISGPDDALPAAAQALRDGASRLVTDGDGETFLHARLPAPRIVIVGATHIAQALVGLARIAGYQTLVVDPRTAFAADDRFPGVSVITDWPEDALPSLGLDPATAVVVLAHIARIDDQGLMAALRSHVRYVGALGSKRNHAKRSERLLAAGLAAADIARIHAPVGLDIGARTPAEIAVAILAEIVQAFRGTRR